MITLETKVLDFPKLTQEYTITSDGVVYNSKGQNPRYNNESPFWLNVYKDNQNITMDCTFSWSILGSTYSKEDGWKDTHYLQKDTSLYK